MLKLAKYLKGYRFMTVAGPLFKLVEAVFELIIPLVVAYIVDTAIPAGQTGNFKGLIVGGVIILALGVLGLPLRRNFLQVARLWDSARI